MAHDANTRVKDVGTRYSAYTITDENGPVALTFENRQDAETVLKQMHSMDPPLLPKAVVTGVRGVILERKGGRPGRKPQTANGTPTIVPATAEIHTSAKSEAPHSGRSPAHK